MLGLARQLGGGSEEEGQKLTVLSPLSSRGVFVYFFTQVFSVDTCGASLIVPILQIRELRPREGQVFVPSCQEIK